MTIEEQLRISKWITLKFVHPRESIFDDCIQETWMGISAGLEGWRDEPGSANKKRYAVRCGIRAALRYVDRWRRAGFTGHAERGQARGRYWKPSMSESDILTSVYSDKDDTQKKVLDILMDLNTADRKMIAIHYFDGVSMSELARQERVSRQAIQQRYGRLLKAIAVS